MVNFLTYVPVFVAAVAASTLKYDSHYSYSTNSALTSYACSDGANGLITKTHTQNAQQLKSKLKPNVYLVAGPSVGGWNSPNCGKCFNARNPKNNKSFKFIVVDVATPALVGGEDAFRAISPSGGLAEGSLNVYLSELKPSDCFY
ncbi:hypothetical protein ABW20_dc0104596 [Dactylellina cionopaga]|nr:hypothetical protein ABW20_dc0104596 [Dactylellina cionopaga]